MTLLVWGNGPHGGPRVFAGASFAFPADPQSIAIAGPDGHIRIFNISAGTVIGDLHGHAHPWGRFAFIDGGRKVLLSAMGRTRAVKDMTVELREFDNGRKLGGWPTSFFSLRPDLMEMAVWSPDGNIAIVELASIKERLAFTVPGGLADVQYSPDQHRLISSHIDPGPALARKCRVWDARDGRLLQALNGKALGFLADNAGVLTTEPDGRVHLVGAGGSDIRTFAGHDGEVSRAVVTPDRKRLITGGRDATIRLWDLATGQPVLVLKGHTHFVNDLAVEPNGAYLISVSHDSTLHVWPSAALAGSGPTETSSDSDTR